LIVVLKPDVPWESLRPFEYNAVSKRMIKQMYRFDAYVYVDGSELYQKMLDFFMRVNPEKNHGLTERTRKGVLRVQL